MKQLFFAVCFAVLTFIAYGVGAGNNSFSGGQAGISMRNATDTVPTLDTMKKKKKGGKDSIIRKDPLHPLKDTTHH